MKSEKISTGTKVFVKSSYRHNDITPFRAYEVVDGDTEYSTIMDDVNDRHSIENVHLIMCDFSNASITDQFTFAHSLIGKEVRDKTARARFIRTVDSVLVIDKNISDLNQFSPSVKKHIQAHGDCVVLRFVGGGMMPLVNSELVSDNELLVLNSEYTAKIFSDKVQVGCQTFPIEVIQKILDISKTLR